VVIINSGDKSIFETAALLPFAPFLTFSDILLMNDSVPTELQYLGEDKTIEEDPDIRSAPVVSFFLLQYR